MPCRWRAGGGPGAAALARHAAVPARSAWLHAKGSLPDTHPPCDFFPTLGCSPDSCFEKDTFRSAGEAHALGAECFIFVWLASHPHIATA